MKLKFAIIILYYLLWIAEAEEDKLFQCFEGSLFSKMKGNLDEDVTLKFSLPERKELYTVRHYPKDCSEVSQIVSKAGSELKVWDQFSHKYLVEEIRDILHLTIFKLETKDFGNYLLRQDLYHCEVYLSKREENKDDRPLILQSDSFSTFYILFGTAIAIFFISISLIITIRLSAKSKFAQFIRRNAKQNKNGTIEDSKENSDSNLPLITNADPEQRPQSKPLDDNPVTYGKGEWMITKEASDNIDFLIRERYVKDKKEEDKYNFTSLTPSPSQKETEAAHFLSLRDKKE